MDGRSRRSKPLWPRLLLNSKPCKKLPPKELPIPFLHRPLQLPKLAPKATRVVPVLPGGPNTTGGGGGAPRPQFYNPESGSIYTFSATPTTSSAPTVVQFTVNGGTNTFALNGANVAWTFGDGGNGTAQATSYTYNGTGSFVAGVKITSAFNGLVIGTGSVAITMSVPTVTSAFTVTGPTIQLTNGYYTASANDTLMFVNGASSNNPYNTLTYNWLFSSGSQASSSLANPTFVYTTTGSYVVTLGVTGSFNAITSGTRKLLISGSI